MTGKAWGSVPGLIRVTNAWYPASDCPVRSFPSLPPFPSPFPSLAPFPSPFPSLPPFPSPFPSLARFTRRTGLLNGETRPSEGVVSEGVVRETGLAQGRAAVCWATGERQGSCPASRSRASGATVGQLASGKAIALPPAQGRAALSFPQASCRYGTPVDGMEACVREMGRAEVSSPHMKATELCLKKDYVLLARQRRELGLFLAPSPFPSFPDS